MLSRRGKTSQPALADKTRCLACAAFVALGVLLAAMPPAAAAKVAMALVLAVDVSESVDAGEYELQHEGIARAFENAEVIDTVQSVGGIDVLMLEWSDRDKQALIADWTKVTDAASGKAFAAKIRAGKRSSNGLTAIGDALLASGAAFENVPDEPARRVIDISGDGMANVGPRPDDIRDALNAEGITINGLAILASEPWLDTYYNNEVIGGEGAFLLQVKDFSSFATAIKQKLLAEISARSPLFRRFAAGQMQ
ncbi:MAG TPA: DUF1194 domain-containing protein [Stellaceae bacterium]|jgi:hypothetical protein|nr:DUF1194 domain-containing protein [Stellaceae bacterium]